MSKVILSVRNLSKTYKMGDRSLTVLQDINFDVAQGESVSIVGTSGSGKTTLLGLCAGLDRSSSGEVVLCDQPMTTLDEDQRAKLRNENIGFIFQDFQLIPTLTALENVTIPLELRGDKKARSTALELLERVGLGSRYNHYPNELSGGEQQRVSLARAFSNSPAILFADEPTGNLDDETSAKVEDLLFALNKEKGTTLIIVTHDNELSQKTERCIKLKGGSLVSDTKSYVG